MALSIRNGLIRRIANHLSRRRFYDLLSDLPPDEIGPATQLWVG